MYREQLDWSKEPFPFDTLYPYILKKVQIEKTPAHRLHPEAVGSRDSALRLAPQRPLLSLGSLDSRQLNWSTSGR